jgi:hypothetical protein
MINELAFINLFCVPVNRANLHSSDRLHFCDSYTRIGQGHSGEREEAE